MLNLKQRTNNSVQLSDDTDATLFLNDDDKLVLKNSAGDMETVATVEGLAAVTPNPKIYRALLTQAGTSAPVATVLQNDLGGTITYTRSSVGQYLVTATGLLNATTGIQLTLGHKQINSNNMPVYGIKLQDNNSFYITTGEAALGFNVYDSIMEKALLTIYKYE